MRKQVKHTQAGDEHAREALVREMAYSLYEKSGFQDGHALENWLAAEAIVGSASSAEGHAEAKPDGLARPHSGHR